LPYWQQAQFNKIEAHEKKLKQKVKEHSKADFVDNEVTMNLEDAVARD